MARSRKGCHTCKKRHRKCDETKPACRMCEAYGLQCEGYAVTLRWTNDHTSSNSSSSAANSTTRRRSRAAAERRALDPSDPRTKPSLTAGQTGAGSDQPSRVRSAVNGLTEPGISYARDRTSGHENGVRSSSSAQSQPVLTAQQGAVSGYSPPLTQPSPATMTTPSDSSVYMQTEYQHQEPENEAQTLELLKAFMKDNIYSLYATTRDSPFPQHMNSLAEASAPLRAIIAAMQLYLSNPESPGPGFQDYSSQSMHLFRCQLNHYDGSLDAGILTAGLLICTLNLFQSLPWSPTLKHMIKAFGIGRSTLPDLRNPRCHPITLSTIEGMGVMDIPAFIRGRTTRSFGIWKEVRASQEKFLRERGSSMCDEVELITSVPRSLLDIFARIDDEYAESALLNWPGQAGEIPLMHHWEAYRLAGVLNCRRYNRDRSRSKGTAPVTSTGPSNDALVARIIAHLDALWESSDRPEYSRYLTLNAVFFPYAAARLEVAVLLRHRYLMDHLRRIKAAMRPYAATENARVLEKMLDEAYETQNDYYDLDEECRRRGVEVSLF